MTVQPPPSVNEGGCTVTETSEFYCENWLVRTRWPWAEWLCCTVSIFFQNLLLQTRSSSDLLKAICAEETNLNLIIALVDTSTPADLAAEDKVHWIALSAIWYQRLSTYVSCIPFCRMEPLLFTMLLDMGCMTLSKHLSTKGLTLIVPSQTMVWVWQLPTAWDLRTLHSTKLAEFPKHM